MILKTLFKSNEPLMGGRTIYETYECPCGKGEVIFDKDEIAGFRDTYIGCNCKECKEKYVFGRGTANEKGNE